MKKVLVIGDACRDVFVYCEAQKLCPDVPVPVLNIIDQSENPGMAKNVQRNIKALGLSCDAICTPNWHNITKTRYVHQKTNHMFFRVDSTQSMEKINMELIRYHYDAIVVSDYNKGFLQEPHIQEICLNHHCVFVDTKKILGPWIENAKFIKINDTEYKNSADRITPNLKTKIIRTLGENGCKYLDKTYSVSKVEIQDVSGAGDTFLAGLVVGYFKYNSIEDAIKFANLCASEVVSHRGVTVPKDSL